MVLAMTSTRPISLPAHGALELLVGLAALVAPFALGFGPAGVIVGVTFGVVVIGLALWTTDSELPVSAHFAFDHASALAAVAAAVLLGLSGDRTAAIVLGALGLVQVALNSSTRYVAPA
jgi:hypothetical protein